jgi:mannose-1-phosphate guanylyltransferase
MAVFGKELYWEQAGCSVSKHFVEKPNLAMAAVASPTPIFGTPTISYFAPKRLPGNSNVTLLPSGSPVMAAFADEDRAFLHLDAKSFEQAPETSINLAVIEKTGRRLWSKGRSAGAKLDPGTQFLEISRRDCAGSGKDPIRDR